VQIRIVQDNNYGDYEDISGYFSLNYMEDEMPIDTVITNLPESDLNSFEFYPNPVSSDLTIHF